jgi:hypothetical protein
LALDGKLEMHRRRIGNAGSRVKVFGDEEKALSSVPLCNIYIEGLRGSRASGLLLPQRRCSFMEAGGHRDVKGIERTLANSFASPPVELMVYLLSSQDPKQRKCR